MNFKKLYKEFHYPGQANFPKGEWMIKEDDDLKFPVAILPESMGGKKNDEGHSQKIEDYATLFSAAPDLLNALLEAKKTIRALNGVGLAKEHEERMWMFYQKSPEMKTINEAIQKATNVQ